MVLGAHEDVAHEVFPVSGVQSCAKARHRVLVAQVVAGHVVVVQPAAHGVDGKGHAIGHARVALAQVEVAGVEGRRELGARDAILGHARKLALDELGELLGTARTGSAQLEGHIGLLQPVVDEAIHVEAQLRLQDLLLERRLVAAHERVGKYLARQHALAVAEGAHHIAQQHAGVVGACLHRARGMKVDAGALHDKGVGACGGRALAGLCAPGKRVDELELVAKRDVAVQHDPGVGHVVVARVGVEVVLVGERRNHVGVAARLEAVGVVGEKRLVETRERDLVGIGHGPAHLVEHHAVGHEPTRLALALHLVMPALLLEDGSLGVKLGEEHGVEVDAHEVQQVLLVGARNRVHRLVREGQGVQEGLHRRLEQVDEGLLHRVEVAAAQHRVLKDVEDARAVGRRGLEGDGERLVGVVVCEPHEGCPRGLMAHEDCPSVYLGQVLHIRHHEAMQFLAAGKGLCRGV